MAATQANPKDLSKPIVAKRGCPTLCMKPKTVKAGVSNPITTKWYCAEWKAKDPGWRREFRAHRHCYRGDFRTEDFPDNPDPSKPDPSKPEYLPDPFKPDPSKPESLPDQVEKMEQEHDDE